jgi:hypothetical protein
LHSGLLSAIGGEFSPKFNQIQGARSAAKAL